MNTVETFLAAISEEDLRAAVGEMKILDETGVLPEGTVRRLTTDLASHSGVRDFEARKIIESAVLRTAAYRWAGVAGSPLTAQNNQTTPCAPAGCSDEGRLRAVRLAAHAQSTADLVQPHGADNVALLRRPACPDGSPTDATSISAGEQRLLTSYGLRSADVHAAIRPLFLLMHKHDVPNVSLSREGAKALVTVGETILS
jgi:hypothetical protein